MPPREKLELFRVCRICGELLPLTPEFFERYSERQSHRLTCRRCRSRRHQEWGREHREDLREYFRNLNATPERKEYKRAYNARRAEHNRRLRERYYAARKTELIAANKRWQEEHREQRRAYEQTNMKEYRRQYARTRYQNDPTHRLCVNVRRTIGAYLQGRKKGRRWEALVGYTLAELKQHLESLFQPGMTWENYGLHGWHIDHVRPICSFSFASAEDPQFRECWALSNLQPLWADENQRKRRKMPAEWARECAASDQ